MKKLTANDPDTRSTDVLAGNAEQIKALFPEAVTEGAVDFDVLKQLLGGLIDEREEKYGLNWHGKRRARQLALTPSTGTLRPCPDDSVDWETTQNLMIEGDNLEVLKLLQKSYSGKVKLIYIDPPYNTGNDFVYPDDFTDSIRNYLAVTGQVDGAGVAITTNKEQSGRFHTEWLNMMYPRLIAARVLLRRDGILAVSIDETELSNLVALSDEVFGSENRIGIVSVVNNLKGRSDDAFLATSHEYLVVYARSRDHAELAGLPLPSHMVEEYDLEDEVGRYKLIPLKKTGKGWRREDRPNMHFPIYVSADCSVVSLEPVPDGTPVLPMKGEEPGRWRWGKDTFMARASRDVVARRVRGGNITVFTKMRLGEEGEERTLTPKTTWIDPKFDSAAGGRDLDELGMRDTFPTPKPLAFIEELLTTASDPECIVVDFFGGSGTTGHAVLNQNIQDKGRRRYILVQLPESLDPTRKEQAVAARFCDKISKPRTLAEVTKERLRRVATRMMKDTPAYKGDMGFRVFRLDSSNIREWDPDRHNLPKSLLESVDHLKTGRTEMDILYELLLKLGLDLCVPIENKKISGKEVHSIGGGVLLACLADKIARDQVEPLAEGIVKWHKALAPAGDTTCVFRDSAFADDVAKTNLAAILNQHGLANVRSL